MSGMLEHLFNILSHPDFLAMKGLTGEVPIFIQTYDPEDEDVMLRTVDSLSSRLRANGISLAVVDLFALLLESWKKRAVCRG